ncbi:MAG: type I 3-dehydroquinate dehydratase [Propioniciclava sp.]
MAHVRLGDVVLGEGRTKVIVPLTGRTGDEVAEQAEALSDHDLDIVEWRADHLIGGTDPRVVVAVGRRLDALMEGRPILFTFRTPAEGGQQSIGPADYLAVNAAVMAAGLVEAVDVEAAFDAAAADGVIAAACGHAIPVVGSWHDFAATPPAELLVERLAGMQQRGCSVVKAAVMPTSPADVLELLRATVMMSTQHPDTPVITVSMAGLGLISRMAAQLVGSCATFAMVGRASAPGQLPVDQLQPILSLVDANLDV